MTGVHSMSDQFLKASLVLTHTGKFHCTCGSSFQPVYKCAAQMGFQTPGTLPVSVSPGFVSLCMTSKTSKGGDTYLVSLVGMM